MEESPGCMPYRRGTVCFCDKDMCNGLEMDLAEKPVALDEVTVVYVSLSVGRVMTAYVVVLSTSVIVVGLAAVNYAVWRKNVEIKIKRTLKT